LIVDSDQVLASAISFQGHKPVARWRAAAVLVNE
jgi:hypothetical protein